MTNALATEFAIAREVRRRVGNGLAPSNLRIECSFLIASRLVKAINACGWNHVEIDPIAVVEGASTIKIADVVVVPKPDWRGADWQVVREEHARQHTFRGVTEKESWTRTLPQAAP